MIANRDPGDECTVGPCIDCKNAPGDCFDGRCKKCNEDVAWLSEPLTEEELISIEEAVKGPSIPWE